MSKTTRVYFGVLQIGLLEMLIVALLSQYNFIGPFVVIFNSPSNLFSHNNSHIPRAIALYYASTLLLATIDCFLLLQVTRFPPINVHHPDVELLLVIDLA